MSGKPFRTFKEQIQILKERNLNFENVPLWVLVNSLTIGNISYFYNSLDELKEKIARKFGGEYMKDYSSKEKITYSELSNIIKIVNYFRNVCASR